MYRAKIKYETEVTDSIIVEDIDKAKDDFELRVSNAIKQSLGTGSLNYITRSLLKNMVWTERDAYEEVTEFKIDS